MSEGEARPVPMVLGQKRPEIIGLIWPEDATINRLLKVSSFNFHATHYRSYDSG
jgi:hypothetical protein